MTRGGAGRKDLSVHAHFSLSSSKLKQNLNLTKSMKIDPGTLPRFIGRTFIRKESEFWNCLFSKRWNTDCFECLGDWF